MSCKCKQQVEKEALTEECEVPVKLAEKVEKEIVASEQCCMISDGECS